MAWLKPFAITGTTAVNLHNFIRYGERQHEFLTGCSGLLGRSEDGPEIVARMAEPPGDM